MVSFCTQCETYLAPDVASCTTCGASQQPPRPIAACWSAEVGEAPSGPLLVAGDLLLVPSQEPDPSAQHSTLHALDLVDGSPRWQRSFEHAWVSGLAAVQTSEVLILVAISSTDLLRGQGALVALDTAGQERYRWKSGVQHVSAPTVTCRGERATEVATTEWGWGAGDRVVCFTADAQMLMLLDVATGEQKARIALEANASLSAPAVVSDVAYVPCRGPHLLAVDVGGRLCRQFDAPASPDTWLDKTPVVAGECLFAVLSTGAVLALRMGDASPAWRVDVGPAGKPLSTPATDGERLFVGAHDGLHALALDGGHKLWTFSTLRRITATPVVTGDVVYAACHDHHLYALDAATGQELWRYQVERRIECSPLVTACGRPPTPSVLIADRGGTLTAVARPPSAAEHEAAGQWIEAASAYAAQSQFARGAALLEAHGEPFKAAQLWERAGERERAAGLYETAGAWRRAAEVWGGLGHLLKQAEALEQHAQLLESQHSSDTDRAAAWAAAAEAFEAEGETGRAATCRREVARRLQQPIITLDVRCEGLVQNAYSRLQFIVRNEGYGSARNLVIHAQGDQFEGEVAATREIATLRAGHERVDKLDVCPRAFGDSVPLRVCVEYENQVEEACICEQTVYIPVAHVQETRGTAQVFQISTVGGTVVIGSVEGSDFVSGAKHTAVDQRGQQVHGPQINVAGDVHGPMPSGDNHLRTEEVTMAPTSDREYLVRLRETLATYFDAGELRTLCFDLGVDYDDLPGEGKANKARELIAYLERRDRIPELVSVCQELRPHVAWGLEGTPGTSPVAPPALSASPAGPHGLEYEVGLHTLKPRLSGVALDEFNVHEAKLLDNLRRERLFGSTETIRSERAAILYALNQLARDHLGTSFNDLCQARVGRQPAATPAGSTSGSQPAGKQDERERASLRAQLENARENLRLIRERKSQYVMETAIPLDLIKQEQRLEEQIADLEGRLAEWGEASGPARVPGQPTGGTTIVTGGGAVIFGDVKVEGGDFVGRDKVVRSEEDDQ